MANDSKILETSIIQSAAFAAGLLEVILIF